MIIDKLHLEIWVVENFNKLIRWQVHLLYICHFGKDFFYPLLGHIFECYNLLKGDFWKKNLLPMWQMSNITYKNICHIYFLYVTFDICHIGKESFSKNPPLVNSSMVEFIQNSLCQHNTLFSVGRKVSLIET